MTAFPRNRAAAAGRTPQRPFTVWRRAFKDNVTSASSISLGVPTATPPSTATAGVHELEPGEGIIIKPYGTDADNEQFRIAVEVWHPLYDRNENVRETETIAWVPTTIAQIDYTINGTAVAAAAAGPLTTADRFCDLSGVVGGSATRQPATYYFTSQIHMADFDHTNNDVPANASILTSLATWGAKYVKFHIDTDGGSGATSASANILFAVI